MATKKLHGSSAMIAAIRKGFGSDAALSPGEERAAAQITECIPTGIDVLDHYVLGTGGLPIGRSSEIFGAEACGKTSLGYAALASVQRMGGVAVVADVEHSFDEFRARTFGVDTDELVLLQPTHLEEFFGQAKLILATHNPKHGPLLIVWDSIASTKTKAGMAADAGDKTPADVARLMSEELPKLLKPLHAKRAHLMMLNQIRTKFGVMFGDNTTTPGGNAPKFYASVRLQFFGGKAVKNKDDEHIAKVVTIMSSKNRCAPPFRKARVRFDYASGYNNLWSTLEHAKRMKAIDPRAEGFKGKGQFSVEAYNQALEVLGWSPPLVGKVGVSVTRGVAASNRKSGARVHADDGSVSEGDNGDLDEGHEDDDS
jgi:recombination protein RecA